MGFGCTYAKTALIPGGSLNFDWLYGGQITFTSDNTYLSADLNYDAHIYTSYDNIHRSITTASGGNQVYRGWHTGGPKTAMSVRCVQD
jgi:hypothetical protein